MHPRGKVCVVTGGASGIGAAVVDRLVASGARVAIWDLEIASPDARLSPLPQERLHFERVDVADPQSVAEAAERTQAALGPVDVLVNSAGIAGPTAALAAYPPELWRKVQAVNLDGTFHACRALVPGMIARNYGRIVNIASIAGKEAVRKNGLRVVAVAPFASRGTTKLGAELGPHGINVNAIAPSMTLTERIGPRWEQRPPEVKAADIERTPLRRMAVAADQAKVIAFLASSDADFVTGLTIDVTGGL